MVMITRMDFKKMPAPAASTKPISRGPLNFKKGDVIRGEVLRDYGKGEVLIRSEGAEFRALTHVRVREGEQCEFRVKVAPGKNHPALLERTSTKALIPALNRGAAKIPSLLSEVTTTLLARNLSPNMSSLVKNLALSGLFAAYSGEGGETAPWLSRLVAEGGLFYEGKVARFLLQGIRSGLKERLGNDLKGNLLELRKALGAEGRGQQEVDPAGQKVNQVLDLIEQMQLENCELLRADGCWLLFVPGRSEEGFHGAELFVRRDKKEKETRFSMLLDFSCLGPVSVTGSILNSAVAIKFEVSQEETAQLVRMSLPLLESALKDKGLMPAQIVCAIGGAESEGERTRVKERRSADAVDVVI